MELMNVWAIVVGLIITAIVAALAFFIKYEGKEKYTHGVKASNTSLIKSSKVYKSLNKQYNVLRAALAIGMVGSILSSLFLVARPYKTQDVYTGVKKRDIIICMDVSYSLYDLNMELVDYLKGVVHGLAGDRIGVNIFNTSTVTYVPMTDDYDYVEMKLGELSNYFVMQKELYEEYYDVYGSYLSDYPDDVYEKYMALREKLEYYDAGTLHHNSSKGSSLIGEGLGTALYTFPYLGEKDRTRFIILSTDNELNESWGYKQIMDVNTAAKYCQSNDVTVYGIFPDEEDFYDPEEYSYSACKQELANAMATTGGTLYVRTDDLPVSAIVKDITKKEVITANMVMSRETQDVPRPPFIALIICLAFTCAAGLVLQK